MEKAVACIIFFIIIIISGFSEGSGVLPDGPINASVGGTVTLGTTLLPPDEPFILVSWNFKSESIITSHAGGNFTGPDYQDRITFFPSTGSLELRGLTRNDSGEYTVTLTPSTGQQTVGTTRLDVYEKISGVSVMSSSSNLLVEGTLINLTCEASGSIHTRNWMKNGVNLVLSDNMTLHDNSRLLSFNPVSGKDSGEYFCNVSNPISHDGATYTMVVNYGPENVQITGPDEITVNQPLKLTCSADSTPSATYTWIVNGKETNIEAAEFVKDGAEYSDSGNYTCRAYNNITERSTSSVVHHLAVGSYNLSGGAIAGIVITCLIVSCGGVAGGFYFYKKKISLESKPQPGKEEQGDHVYENVHNTAIYDKTI